MGRQRFVIPFILTIALVVVLIQGNISLGPTTRTTPSISLSGTQNTISTSGNLYISPYGSHDIVIQQLQKAKYNIRIRGYQISDKEVIQLLKNKAKMGVSVQILLENNTHGGESEDYFDFFKDIQGAGIEVKTDEKRGTNYIHAKTIIIDDRVYIISSGNFSYSSFFNNRDYRFVGNDMQTIQYLLTFFRDDRNNKKSIDTLPPSLRICPYNCRKELREFVQSAKKSISIQAQYLEDPLLIEQLHKQTEKGVVLNILVGKYQEQEKVKKIQKHLSIMQEPNLHAKNILIDDTKMYIGSMNLSTNAIENNREIGIVTNDIKVIQKFQKQFEKDWKTAQH